MTWLISVEDDDEKRWVQSLHQVKSLRAFPKGKLLVSKAEKKNLPFRKKASGGSSQKMIVHC